MADIQTIRPDDPEHEKVREQVSNIKLFNYREIAEKIAEEPAGTILKVAGERRNFTNLKSGIQRRGLVAGEDFDMSFSGEEGNKEVGEFLITVLEKQQSNEG